MNSNRRLRAASNLALLELAGKKLGELNDDIVYLGGCTTALLINDPLALDVRPTVDVDCIVDVISLVEYYKFKELLLKKGFTESIKDDVICRFRSNEVILDVMPTDQKILGFGNPWYKKVMQHAIKHKLSNNLMIKFISAPYFLATKLEAFKTRGKNNLWSSHDYEDIISVLLGCTEIVKQVAAADFKLITYLKKEFQQLLKNDQFEQTLPGHVNDGPATMHNVQVVLNRMNQILAIGLK